MDIFDLNEIQNNNNNNLSISNTKEISNEKDSIEFSNSNNNNKNLQNNNNFKFSKEELISIKNITNIILNNLKNIINTKESLNSLLSTFSLKFKNNQENLETNIIQLSKSMRDSLEKSLRQILSKTLEKKLKNNNNNFISKKKFSEEEKERNFLLENNNNNNNNNENNFWANDDKKLLKKGNYIKDGRGYCYIFPKNGINYKYHILGSRNKQIINLYCSDSKCSGKGFYDRKKEKFHLREEHNISIENHSYFFNKNLFREKNQNMFFENEFYKFKIKINNNNFK